MTIPFVDLKPQYLAIQDEVDAAIRSVVESARFVGGPELEAFEQEFAAYCDADFAIGVGNGTDALELALQALGIGPGDEVITQANSFMATASAIVRVGAKPVFVDIDPDTYTIDPQQIEAAITPQTKAIIPVHLYGQPADMNPINEIAQRRKIYVVEDAAQAHGAKYEGKRVGSLGHMACFSFYPGKNLGAYGDGGAITSNDAGLIERITQLREHGRTTKYEHAVVGSNSRLDALQAAVLRVKLRHLDHWSEQRQQVAKWYTDRLAGGAVETPTIRAGSSHVFHLFVVETNNRKALAKSLDCAGVATGIHYPLPLHLQPALANLNITGEALQRTELSAHRILSLPMFPELSQQQVERVVNVIEQVASSSEKLSAAE